MAAELTPPWKVSALKAPALPAWRSLDHVAGWEMGNELFWAKSQEQRGFKDTAAHTAQCKVSSHRRTSAFPSSKSTAEFSVCPSDFITSLQHTQILRCRGDFDMIDFEIN